VTQYKYLGMWVNDQGYEKTKTEKMFKAHQWYGQLGSVAKFRENKYEVLRGIWEKMVVPSIMYGANFMA